MIGIALIDDHSLVSDGFGAWLCATGRFTIVGTAGTLAQARSLMEQLEPLPDIVILDISLGTEDGLNFIPILKEVAFNRNVAMPGILVCSIHEDPFLIKHALDLGAKAFVAKSSESEEIIRAIDTILAGNTYVNPKHQMHPRSFTINLTRRENEIVTLIKQTLSTRQIAKRLGISLRTVENHLTHIYIKTDTSSRVELMSL